MFDGKNGLRGARIASFRMPLTGLQIAVRILSIAWIVFWLARFVYFKGKSGPPSWIGLIGILSTDRRVQFYEKGLGIPKALGEVFLAQDQLLDIKLDGDRFIVTGPDATWGGPYSGGTFRIRTKDLPKFQDVLARFRLSLTAKELPAR